MKIFKPKFWQNKLNFFSIIFLPVSVIFLILISIRKLITLSKKFKIPVICVGNIYIGGTGKTPLSILITNKLKKRFSPVIIKKYYKNHKDEHKLIKENTDNLILNNKRTFAIEEAIRMNFNVAILDDGFQDHTIFKDLNILCFNSKQLIGNGMIFPSGPLREGINSLRRAKIVIINGNNNEKFEKKIMNINNDLEIYYSKYLPLNISEFVNKKVYAFAGIGNPENFFELLKSNNLNIKKAVSFPDHYQFSKVEIQDMVDEAHKNDFVLITTEKDHQRIKEYGFKNIKFIKLELKIFDEKKFINQILNIL